MIGAWKGFLFDNVAKWRLPAGGEWSFVIHNNYQPHCSNLNVMWFHNHGAFPRVVVKFCTDPAPLKKEFENMRRAHQCAPAVVPGPLHFGPHGHLWGLWMEGVPGSVLTTAKGYAPDALHSLVAMVATLHAAVRHGGRNPLDPDRYRLMGQEPLAALEHFGPSAAVKAGCSQVAAAISAPWLNALPLIPQHGDLYSGNVLSHRDRFYVVDWESFGAVDLPFYDLLILLYSLLRDTGATPATWQPSLMNRVPSLIRSYAQRLDLAPSDVSLLLPLALANWFYIHLKEGHKTFTENMYRTIQQYFEGPEPWTRAFLS
jgi:aminoglycoside phosphotransferase (APT) family kinase protein